MIDADDLGDVRPFVSWTDADFEGFTRLHGVDAALSQHAPMEEGVAGPIRNFDKSEALSGLNHLTRPWTGGPSNDWLNWGRVPKARGCG